MSIEKEREAFEHWVSEFGLNVSTEDGLYRSHVVGWMWHAWQAGRAALQSRDREDALRYRYLVIKLQQAYDGECFDAECFSVYCRMLNQHKGNRTILAEIAWRDKSDEPIGLNEAIDHARRIEGETK